ncbi:MAG: DUF7282 domain-containing protein [Acidimicrobiia bacterium]
MKKRYLAVSIILAMVVAACAGAGEDTTTTEAAEVTTTAAAATTTAAEAEGPATGPSALGADAQETDGTTIVIATVTLPSPGFIAIHGDADGSPGPVVGHSDLLPAGDSTDVTVTLDEPLTESGTLWPMVHIDFNDNGEYEFFPPDETTDVPGVTDSGDVAVIPVEMTVG